MTDGDDMRTATRRITDPSLCPRVVHDPVYRFILGEAAWARLSPAIRMRFSVKPMAGSQIAYRGVMRVRRSPVGWAFAQAARLFGRPIVAGKGDLVPVAVTLRAHPDGGVEWTRTYRFDGRTPVSAASIKRYDARDGLVESATGGFGMRLRVTEESGGLHFRGAGYFLRFWGIRAPLPDWAGPGALHVEHRDEGPDRFRFRLTIRHPVFGLTFLQDGVFQDQEIGG